MNKNQNFSNEFRHNIISLSTPKHKGQVNRQYLLELDWARPYITYAIQRQCAFQRQYNEASYVMLQYEWPCYIECLLLSRKQMIAFLIQQLKQLIKLKYAARPTYYILYWQTHFTHRNK